MRTWATVQQFDESVSRRLEATYLTPDIAGQRRSVRTALELRPGERVLDIGSGPGLLAAEMAKEVGPSGAVEGIDSSESMLAIARRRQPPDGASPVRFARADAIALPFAPDSFDAAVSTQVYEYVDDVAAALRAAHRVLRPGGRLVILDTDWDSVVWHSRDPAAMRRVLAVWEEHVADAHLPRRLTGLLKEAGFSVNLSTAIPILNVGYDANTYSAGLVAQVAAFVAGRGGLTDADVSAWVEDLAALGRDYFFSVNRYMFQATKPTVAGASRGERGA
jgi:arsenite methyltransferase